MHRAFDYQLQSNIINGNLVIKVHALNNAHGSNPTKITYFAKITSKNMSIEIPKPYYSIEALAKHLNNENNYAFHVETQSLEIMFKEHKMEVEVQMFV